ncbi:MAG: dihydrodipicolinate synthase family protein [Acidimicrobiia bacterium]
MLPPPEYMPALITPFTRSGEVDTRAHTFNLRVLSKKGIQGFVIGGSNGEGPYLEPGERGRLVRSGRRRKAHFMVGIAGESTRVALRQVQEAADAGADSVLVMTPTTVARGRDEAILRFYRTVADASPVPVFIYSVPAVTGYSLPIELVWRISRHEKVMGMKDSSGDVVRLQSIIDAAPPGFIVYSGSSRALTAAIAVGCHGAITGSGNYLPDLVLQTIAAAKESPEKARRLQKRLSSVSADVEAHGIPGVKAAAKAAGLDPGHPREPLTRLSRGAETSIAKLI